MPLRSTAASAPSRTSRSFLGEQATWRSSKAVVVPVPYDSATSFRGGAREGPAAVLDASLALEWYDRELGIDVGDRVPVHTLDPFDVPVSGPERMIALVKHDVRRILKANKFPVAVGGDHSLTAGCVQAIAERYRSVTVVQLDAHGDLRDTYQDSGHSHACVMQRCYELTGRLIQVGIREVDEEQAAFQRSHRIPVFPAPTVPVAKILAVCSTRDVYISIDVDVFDPSIMPATGTPFPGGLGWYPVLELLRALGRKRRIVGADIVELAPIPGLVAPNILAASLILKLLGYALFRR